MKAIIPDRARKQRASEVENAMASVRMEGLEPSEETKALFNRYIYGELTSEELDRAFENYLDCEYGPVCLSGN